jgi:hypothetical protein
VRSSRPLRLLISLALLACACAQKQRPLPEVDRIEGRLQQELSAIVPLMQSQDSAGLKTKEDAVIRVRLEAGQLTVTGREAVIRDTLCVAIDALIEALREASKGAALSENRTTESLRAAADSYGRCQQQLKLALDGLQRVHQLRDR